MTDEEHIPVALTIAGSDSGGGAGIQADLRTFAALRVFGTCAVTLVTAQNTLGVSRIDILDPELVGAQIDSVMTDFHVGAAKTGALGSKEVIELVSAKMEEYEMANLVVDPVMVSKHGSLLIEDSAKKTLIDVLFPRALLITPNAHEACAILGVKPDDLGDPEDAARKLAETGARAVLLKGGHLSSDDAVDYFFDGETVHRISAPRVETKHTHGTGCTLSSAITAYIARGRDLIDAVREGKKYVSGALRAARRIGHGVSPTHHMHEYYEWGAD